MFNAMSVLILLIPRIFFSYYACAEEDALKAVEVGVSAIQVSNHGGRQLDNVPSSVSISPTIIYLRVLE